MSYNTSETCEGTVCRQCKICIDLCMCNPERKLGYRSLDERLSGQGLIPQTEINQNEY